MSDLIRRQAAIDALEQMRNLYSMNDCPNIYAEYKRIIDEINNLPSAQRKGKWIKHKDRSCWYCSECNTDNYYAYTWDCNTGKNEFQDNFCPNCGASMER